MSVELYDSNEKNGHRIEVCRNWNNICECHLTSGGPINAASAAATMRSSAATWLPQTAGRPSPGKSGHGHGSGQATRTPVPVGAPQIIEPEPAGPTVHGDQWHRPGVRSTRLGSSTSPWSSYQGPLGDTPNVDEGHRRSAPRMALSSAAESARRRGHGHR